MFAGFGNTAKTFWVVQINSVKLPGRAAVFVTENLKLTLEPGSSLKLSAGDQRGD